MPQDVGAGTPAGLPAASTVAQVEGPSTRWCVPGTECPISEAVGRVVRKVRADAVPVLSGHLAFRVVFALFPALISLLWLLNVVNAEGLTTAVSDLVETIVPGVANAPLKEQVDSAPRAQANGDLTFGVGLSLIVATWAIAEVFRAAMHALNVIYEVEERRSVLRRLVTSLVVSVLTLSLFVVALALVVFGARVSAELTQWSGLSVGYRFVWSVTAWLVVVTSAVAAFALTYYFAPDVEQRLRWVRSGSLVGVALWLAFTALFAVYVNVLSRPSETYGSLAGIAFFMVYVYASAFILLLGAEINQVVEQWEPEGKNAGEREPTDG